MPSPPADGEVPAIIPKSVIQRYLYPDSSLWKNYLRVNGCTWRKGSVIMLKMILSEFLNNSGVTAAALVGRDGFVIDLATNGSLDSDALGALGSSSINFFENGNNLMERSQLRQMTLEYHNGAIILTPITREEFLMILTDTTVGLGNLAFRIANTSLRVAAAM
jgi:predicted regulator of Ras-like GTPase activity (Roadblock/LC7/MglB family)